MNQHVQVAGALMTIAHDEARTRLEGLLREALALADCCEWMLVAIHVEEAYQALAREAEAKPPRPAAH
ncbi:hypothetical protein ACU5AX_13600 [Sphingomonas sp. XXL09]|uniref:hypothetical protein n=1 Tax=Sphingomonas sp. XXL09 TaxID=3457787 RepID=UPI00406BCBFA